MRRNRLNCIHCSTQDTEYFRNLYNFPDSSFQPIATSLWPAPINHCSTFCSQSFILLEPHLNGMIACVLFCLASFTQLMFWSLIHVVGFVSVHFFFLLSNKLLYEHTTTYGFALLMGTWAISSLGYYE